MKNLKNIKAAVFDVDGTMTDGKIWLSENGHWRRKFCVLDGAGIHKLQNCGFITGIITAAESEDIRVRAEHLNVEYFYDFSRDKLKDFNDFLSKTKLLAKEVCYIGDDLFDLPVIKECGFSVCPKNAAHEIKQEVNLITKSPGGSGAVRELCDLLLKYGYL